MATHLGLPSDDVSAPFLVKKSLDARHKKQNWRAVYRVNVANEEEVLAKQIPSVRRWTVRDEGRYGLDARGPSRDFEWPKGLKPIVVGAGPAGLFAALYLAEAGARCD